MGWDGYICQYHAFTKISINLNEFYSLQNTKFARGPKFSGSDGSEQSRARAARAEPLLNGSVRLGS